MTQHNLTAEDIARFLADHPQFFAQHSELFSTLQVPARNEAGVISFADRQISHLQEENRQLKEQLATLIRNAQRNETIRQRTHQWACKLIANPQWARDTDAMAKALATLFELDFVRLLPAELLPTEMIQTYTGASAQAPVQFDLPAGLHSMAYTPLNAPQNGSAQGVLVLASQNPEHFTADMATDFLEHLASLCAAALQQA